MSKINRDRIFLLFVFIMLLFVLISILYHVNYKNTNLITGVFIYNQTKLDNITYVIFSNNITANILYELDIDKKYDLFIKNDIVTKITPNMFHLDYELGRLYVIIIEICIIIILTISYNIIHYFIDKKSSYMSGYYL